MPAERYDALVLEWKERDRSRYEPAAQIAALTSEIETLRRQVEGERLEKCKKEFERL